MWLVQRGGVQHGADALHAALDAAAIGDRADDGRGRRRQHVEPDHVHALAGEDAHERLAEMPGAAGDEDAHAHDVSGLTWPPPFG